MIKRLIAAVLLVVALVAAAAGLQNVNAARLTNTTSAEVAFEAPFPGFGPLPGCC